MSTRFCEFCHTDTGDHLPDCENAPVVEAPDETPETPAPPVYDPYADHQPRGLWGSPWVRDANGNQTPAVEIPATIIHSKR